jgi:hypothetical protein
MAGLPAFEFTFTEIDGKGVFMDILYVINATRQLVSQKHPIWTM